jgi:hypothetical protein
MLRLDAALPQLFESKLPIPPPTNEPAEAEADGECGDGAELDDPRGEHATRYCLVRVSTTVVPSVSFTCRSSSDGVAV